MRATMAAMRWGLAVLACTGCDVVFGLEGDDLPEDCTLVSFADATGAPIGPADNSSTPADEAYRIVSLDGFVHEVQPGDVPGPHNTVDFLPPTSVLVIAVSPEGDRVFASLFADELTRIVSGRRVGTRDWELVDDAVPAGRWPGTPSASRFGAPRMIVRLSPYADEHPDGAEVQEYEERDGAWHPVGERRRLRADLGVNLSPDGLTISYAGYDATGARGVFAQSRSGVDEWFREPPLLLRAGEVRAAQLSADCRRLDVIESRVITRYSQ